MFDAALTILAQIDAGSPTPPSDPWTVAAAIGVGLAVAFGIVAIFSQRGSPEITPEREVALAAGNLDRHTAFESSIFGPPVWLLLVLVRRLHIPGFRRRLRGWLIAAGSPNFYTPDEYLAVSLLWGLGAAVALEVGNMLTTGSLSVFLPLAGLFLGVTVSLYAMHGRAGKRTHAISRRVPYTLDLIALAMGAGATFTEAVRTVVREDTKHPFNVELNTVLAEMDLGTTRQQAMNNLSDRVPLEQLRSIIAAIIQAEGLGTPLSDVLKQQATLMRHQRSVRAEELAARASVRILLPGLVIMMAVVLMVFGPFIIRAIQGKLMM